MNGSARTVQAFWGHPGSINTLIQHSIAVLANECVISNWRIRMVWSDEYLFIPLLFFRRLDSGRLEYLFHKRDVPPCQ